MRYVRMGILRTNEGRGVRSLGFEDRKRVSNSADSAKTRFVLIDAVGVEKSLKTESCPLEKSGVPLKDLLMGRWVTATMILCEIRQSPRAPRQQLDDRPKSVSKNARVFQPASWVRC